MTKLIRLLVILIVLYFGIELMFINLNKGHVIEYKIKTDNKRFEVKEVYSRKKKNEIDNYYFEIKVDDDIFVYQTYKDYKKANYIIKKIDYFEGDKYKCISLIGKNNLYISDILCKKDNIEYFYSSIKGEDKSLDKYVSKLNNYEVKKDNLKSKIDASPVTLYDDNIVDDHYIVLQNYKGVYLINKDDKIRNITIFDNDVYEQEAAILSGKNYVIADYDQDFKFHEFYSVNILNGKKNTVISNDEISLESYMQGAIDNDVYLFDKSDKKQYRINIKYDTVSVSGKASEGIQVYENDKFKIGSAYDSAKEHVSFNKYSAKNTFNKETYSKVDKVGNKLSGYYYLYKQNGNAYDVYRVNVQNKNVLVYLFSTTSLETYYDSDYVYFKSNSAIKYFNQDVGIKTLLKDSEMKFNKTLSYGLYVK